MTEMEININLKLLAAGARFTPSAVKTKLSHFPLSSTLTIIQLVLVIYDFNGKKNE